MVNYMEYLALIAENELLRTENENKQLHGMPGMLRQ
jgi:hypothetical protein